MSLLRFSGPSQLAATCMRLPRPFHAPARRSISSTAPRWSRSEGKEVTDGGWGQNSSLAPTSQDVSERLPSHDLDHTAHIDHGTSNFSPVPKRVMDGSEPGDVLAAAVLSGAPIDLQARQVRIYRPAKTATQSGTWHGHHWRMDWDILQKGHRWENPLMGWQSSADAMQGTHIDFKTKEEAIQFALKQGYEYVVQKPNERKVVVKSYAANFLHEPKKLKHIKTK